MSDFGISRREFLVGAAAATALVFTAEELLAAEGATEEAVTGPPVKFGVVGLGQWGKEIVASLAKMPSAQVTAICDSYEKFLTKAKELAPGAASFTDYRQLLASPDVEAVVVATPSHLHKEIALEAIQAGKHVYVEAPLAHSVEDARAIALAGQGSTKVFQVGVQGRSNAMYKHVARFVKTGVLGDKAQAFAQDNKKESWKRMAPTSEREAELNWRLSKATSPGLPGEEGIHRIDLANWYMDALPVSVTGFGSIQAWNDGRDVPDTVHVVLEYPGKVRMIYMATLASSFSNTYSLFQGNNASLALREKKGWLVKEADSALLGWEVYAHKEECFGETGICMVADATKILQAGKEPGAEGSHTKEAVYLALENFTRSIREEMKPACGVLEGYQATVTALKANEATLSGTRIAFEPSWFELK